MHHLEYYFHDYLFDFLKRKDLDELYVSYFIMVFASSMVGIFIPVYLLTLGYNLQNILVYYFIYYLSLMILFFLGEYSNIKLGVKKTLGMGIIFYVFAYYFLNRLSSGGNYYFVAIIFGLATAFYWSGFHIDFTKSTLAKKEGKEVSFLNAVAIIASTLSPFLGSLLISQFSFSVALWTASGILFLSIAPLFFSKDFEVKNSRPSIKKMLTIDSNEKATAYGVTGFLGIVSVVLWPLFIYLTLKNVDSLGIIISLSALLTTFVVFYLGKLSDKTPGRVLKMGVFSNSPVWILRIFLLSPFGLLFTNLVGSITGSAIGISFTKITFEKAKKIKDIINYFLFREFYLFVGRMILLIIALLLENLVWMFVIASLVTFGYLIVLKEKKELNKNK